MDADLNAIKGGGACQLREKVLADMADTWVMVADYRKNSAVLGTNVSGSEGGVMVGFVRDSGFWTVDFDFWNADVLWSGNGFLGSGG